MCQGFTSFRKTLALLLFFFFFLTPAFCLLFSSERRSSTSFWESVLFFPAEHFKKSAFFNTDLSMSLSKALGWLALSCLHLPLFPRKNDHGHFLVRSICPEGILLPPHFLKLQNIIYDSFLKCLSKVSHLGSDPSFCQTLSQCSM